MAKPNPANSPTFLFHDYETWGAKPSQDPACQFAAIRTDENLNPIGAPINIMCQIANDYLPHPEACLVTGITPQQSLRDGSIEAEFAAKIHAVMMQPNTCTVGYNSIRFDDEVTRHLLYRNFYDPYAREYKNSNSRWDIIDLVRACYALRPDGIVWPEREDGAPSFKLEHLTQANGLEHGNAHDALSDVYATIALARLIKEKQPKLFDYALSLRSKHEVMKHIAFDKPGALLHISSQIPASQGCATWVVPLAKHPTNPNAVIVVDLCHDPEVLISGSAELIRDRLYTKQSELTEGETRPGLKLIHINKSPFVANAKTMTAEIAERLGIDREQCLTNFKRLSENQTLREKVVEVYTDEREFDLPDPDQALYQAGFPTDDEQRWKELVLDSEPHALGDLADITQNPRLKTQLFRYRARNYPHLLTEQEMLRWQAHRRDRLHDPKVPAGLNIEQFMVTLHRLAEQFRDDKTKMRILRDLEHYATNL